MIAPRSLAITAIATVAIALAVALPVAAKRDQPHHPHHPHQPASAHSPRSAPGASSRHDNGCCPEASRLEREVERLRAENADLRRRLEHCRPH